ncbi:hypothetical protein TorRG33x02_230340 [Trema orientale]|uniref:Uncharacterized protein n=1 Tax=Trema orientale TaxID=63057 RepID=A0A2P5E6P3_TREOI|nr:hypothetical protein TorRG33x02_230340 [Trema orientale]
MEGGNPKEVKTSIFAMSFKKTPISIPPKYNISSCELNLGVQKGKEERIHGQIWEVKWRTSRRQSKFIIDAVRHGGSLDFDCNIEECAPDKEVISQVGDLVGIKYFHAEPNKQ